MKKVIPVLLLAALLSLALALPAGAAKDTNADRVDAARLDKIHQFNMVGVYAPETRATDIDLMPTAWDPNVRVPSRTAPRQSVGSALSPTAGIGKGASVDLTYDDWQWTRKHGRYIATYYNGEVGGAEEVDVHFVYEDAKDTTGDHNLPEFQENTYTGHNIYTASGGGDWPLLQNIGCDLQATDTAGTGIEANIDVTHGGLAVIAARSRFFLSLDADTRLNQNMIFYEGTRWECSYDPLDDAFGNCDWIDSTLYRPLALEQPGTGTNYGWNPQVVMSWDGTDDITHVILGEDAYGAPPSTDDYVNGLGSKVCMYFRKVGGTSYTGTWSTGIAIDTTWYHGWSLAVAPYPNQDNLAVCYTNPSYYGALLNQAEDLDVWVRRSSTGGLSWTPAVSVTNYTNAIADDPAHFTCWIESQAFFDLNADLHVVYNAKPTSADPYFDGFNWQDFDENVYHWTEATGNIVKVANGNFMNPDMLTGSMNTLHCGFGGVNAGYVAFQSISQCDNKLYIVWNQIHERANRFPWRDAETQPAPTILDDCAYDAPRLSAANFEIMVSVAQLGSPDLWDAPRSVSDTYTPGCGMPDDPEAAGLCGSEYKPSVERYSLDESLLSLDWPAETEVDVSPAQDYSGGHYLNMVYVDDQYPGSFWRPDLRGNTNPTLNSMKWIRMACVEPIEASQIQVLALGLQWPSWVMTGQTTAIPLTVVNEGNVILNVTDVSTTETTGSGWLSVSIAPTVGSPFEVNAGVFNTATFDVSINAGAISQPTWLDGTVTLTSDAANFPTYDVNIHLLAASYVEPVAWDTVMTHVNMFSPFFEPVGECVALAVGNTGDLGWGAGSGGSINMDYVESGLECNDRARDAYYLIGATPFTIVADDALGTNAKLTQVFNDADQADETGWDPTNDEGSLANGEQLVTAANGNVYDYAFTGRFVNRDTTVAMEREVFAPRSTTPASDIINFVVVRTKVYSADGMAHNHVTFGDVIDWDVPADSIPNNSSFIGEGVSGDFLYLTGTDTANSTSCQSNTGRLATHAFGGFYTTADWNADGCAVLTANSAEDYYGFNALYQTLMVDTTHYRNGTDLVPDQPLPDVWWAETSVPGLNAGDNDIQNTDQAVWCTYRYDYSLGATEELNFWTVITTTRDADAATLAAQVDYARCWFAETVLECDPEAEASLYCVTTPETCCQGTMRGDANNSGADMPTIGDISAMIDAKFIRQTCVGIIPCPTEADVNGSSQTIEATCADVTIGDISLMTDFLFVTGPANWVPPYTLKPCILP
jgi:hypothetical protein